MFNHPVCRIGFGRQDAFDECKKRNNYLLFGSSSDLERFFSRKICPIIGKDIDYCVMQNYDAKRILFTAEHAQTERHMLPHLGGRAYAGVGDKNTDALAKIGAYYLRSAYILPLFIRTEADASRPPEELGNGLRLFVKPKYASQETTYIPIHKDRAASKKLEEYHNTIGRLNPKTIVSVHGIGEKREFDLLFGFGEDYEAIGGKKEAFRFKNQFTEFLDDVFREASIRTNLKIGVSTWRFTGSQNYTLTRHVIEHNRRTTHEKDKRLGMQIELNFRGRVDKKDRELPTFPYQLMVQALGDFVYRWGNGPKKAG